MEERPDDVALNAEAGTTGGGANQEDGPHLSPLHGLGLWDSEVKELKKNMKTMIGTGSSKLSLQKIMRSKIVIRRSLS